MIGRLTLIQVIYQQHQQTYVWVGVNALAQTIVNVIKDIADISVSDIVPIAIFATSRELRNEYALLK